MNNLSLKFKYITIFLAGISATSMSAIANAEWSISAISFRDLNNNHIEARAFDINNVGQVVGYYQGTYGQMAYIVGPDGAVGDTPLGTIGGNSSIAFAINDSGQVTGSANNDILHAYITGPNGVGTKDLGTIGGFSSGGYGINNSGQVVGYSYLGGPRSNHHAFITGPNGEGMTDLGTLGGRDSFAYGINDTGQVVGASDTDGPSFSTPHAFITDSNGEGMTDLGTLGGRGSVAHAINNSGQVVGASDITGNTESHAFITGPNGKGMIDLGTFGGINSVAVDINNSGQAVGYTLPTFVHAFLYSNGDMIDLSKLEEVVAAGWTDLYTAEGINDYGQIVGVGLLHGKLEVYVLSPFSIPPYPVTTVIVSSIPEPETYTMLLAGLGLLGFMAHRRKV